MGSYSLTAITQSRIHERPTGDISVRAQKYVQKHQREVGEIWILLYDIHYRVLDLETYKHNIEKRLKALEGNE